MLGPAQDCINHFLVVLVLSCDPREFGQGHIFDVYRNFAYDNIFVIRCVSDGVVLSGDPFDFKAITKKFTHKSLDPDVVDCI